MTAPEIPDVIVSVVDLRFIALSEGREVGVAVLDNNDIGIMFKSKEGLYTRLGLSREAMDTLVALYAVVAAEHRIIANWRVMVTDTGDGAAVQHKPISGIKTIDELTEEKD